MLVFYRSANAKPLSRTDRNWWNCGYETTDPIAPVGNVEPLSLLDWEPHDHVRRSNYNGWRKVAKPLCYVYDPLGINPWDYMGIRNTLTGHSRRAMRALVDHAKRLVGAGIDGEYSIPCVSIYPPLGYDHKAYMEWAGAKLKACNRVCQDAGISRYCVLLTLRQNVSPNWRESTPLAYAGIQQQFAAFYEWAGATAMLGVWGYAYDDKMLNEDRQTLRFMHDFHDAAPIPATEDDA